MHLKNLTVVLSFGRIIHSFLGRVHSLRDLVHSSLCQNKILDDQVRTSTLPPALPPSRLKFQSVCFFKGTIYYFHHASKLLGYF